MSQRLRFGIFLAPFHKPGYQPDAGPSRAILS